MEYDWLLEPNTGPLRVPCMAFQTHFYYFWHAGNQVSMVSTTVGEFPAEPSEEFNHSLLVHAPQLPMVNIWSELLFSRALCIPSGFGILILKWQLPY